MGDQLVDMGAENSPSQPSFQAAAARNVPQRPTPVHLRLPSPLTQIVNVTSPPGGSSSEHTSMVDGTGNSRYALNPSSIFAVVSVPTKITNLAR